MGGMPEQNGSERDGFAFLKNNSENLKLFLTGWGVLDSAAGLHRSGYGSCRRVRSVVPSRPNRKTSSTSCGLLSAPGGNVRGGGD